jgi:molecular chaperone GrpE (heat shock protein)
MAVKADTVSELEQLVNKWLQVEKQTAELNTHWLEQKTSMEQTLTLLSAEQAQLNKLSNNRKKNASELSKKRERLVSKQAKLENEQQQLTRDLEGITQQLLSMQAQLPPPLLSSWKNTGDLTNSLLTNTEKLQIVLKMLTLLNDFQQRITIHEMAIKHPDGQEVWVKQLYLGAAQAWFVSEDLSYTGIGYATELGWQWTFDASIDAEQVALGIAVQQKKRAAEWVTLPVLTYTNKTQQGDK